MPRLGTALCPLGSATPSSADEGSFRQGNARECLGQLAAGTVNGQRCARLAGRGKGYSLRKGRKRAETYFTPWQSLHAVGVGL
jgi:hypothetical protein